MDPLNQTPRGKRSNEKEGENLDAINRIIRKMERQNTGRNKNSSKRLKNVETLDK